MDSHHKKTLLMQQWRQKAYIEPVLENRGLVILASLDVQGAFDSAWWPGIIHGLRDLNSPRNINNLSKEYFNNRTAILTTNNYTIEIKITRAHPKVRAVRQLTGTYCTIPYCH
jgi:hypothetical protein